MLVLPLENKIRQIVTSYFLTRLLESGCHSNKQDIAGERGKLEGIFFKKNI